MKKIFLALLLTVVAHAEEHRAIVIRAHYSFGNEVTNAKELTTLLSQGWIVTSTTAGSGNESTNSYWLVILKK
jgi:hypothetical protein